MGLQLHFPGNIVLFLRYMSTLHSLVAVAQSGEQEISVFE
jgi:hypothetical protein